MHAGQELGVHHVEFIVQSNAFPAAELTNRVEAFVQQVGPGYGVWRERVWRSGSVDEKV